MSGKDTQHKKKNGIYYTPELVSTLLTREGLETGSLSILDPACGDGALLMAAAEGFKGVGARERLRLVGCDRFRPRRLAGGIEFVCSDFLAWESHEEFDLILTNPPYVGARNMDQRKRRRYHMAYGKPAAFSSNADLWVYFLSKSVTHLKRGGTIAAVLPWSFLEAGYAQEVRRWVAEKFESVRVLVLEGSHFEDTVKQVLLVWLRGYGSPAKRVEIGCADACDGKPEFGAVAQEVWTSENAMGGLDLRVGGIVQALREAGFGVLEDYAKVSIGVVTGANDYFILSRGRAKELAFSGASVLPILTCVEDLRRVAGAEAPDRVLVNFSKLTKRTKGYIDRGLKLGLCDRIHCRRRVQQGGAWYEVDTGHVPDAFFTYRVSRTPYLMLNPDGYQCTNSLHKILFNGISEEGRKWIQLSLLSVFGQLSLEIGARHYGNGIMKVEPKVLKKAFVYTCERSIPTRQYKTVLRNIFEGRKDRACAVATRLVAKEANISKRVAADVLGIVNRIRKRRGAAPVEDAACF